MVAVPIENLTLSKVSRISSGIDEMDWLWSGDGPSWGMPTGCLTLLGGEAGAGKTRAVCAICSAMMQKNKNARTLYFQLEMPMSQFNGKCGSLVPRDGRFFVCGEKELDKMIAEIRRVRPLLVIIDSVNKIAEFNNGYGANLIEEKFRSVIEPLQSHAIFITQLNAMNGIKGGTTLPHMVDTVFTLYKLELKDIFYIKVLDKHRFGPTGHDRLSQWEHKEFGAVCVSTCRLIIGTGDDWLEAHGEKGRIVNEETIGKILLGQTVEADAEPKTWFQKYW